MPEKVFLSENLLERAVCQATVHGVARVGHNLETQPPSEVLLLKIQALAKGEGHSKSLHTFREDKIIK